MSNAEIIYAAVVLFVGIPAARWNWTAAALVMCYAFMQGSDYGLGIVYPTHVSVLADLTVIAVIFDVPMSRPTMRLWLSFTFPLS